MNATRQHEHRSIAHLLLTVAGMTGIAGLFLPFTWGNSPVDAVLEGAVWRLALPFFLTVLVSAASLRWIISGSFSGPERAIAYFVSASMAGVTLSVWFPEGPSTTQDWFAILSPEVIFAFGVYFLIRNSRIEAFREFNPVMALQLAYIAHAVLCLIGFLGNLELGAYFVLAAVLAFVLQIVLVVAQRGQL